MLKKITLIAALFSTTILFNSCVDKDGTVNIFSIEDDKKFGLQAKQEIEGNPAEYPLLPETGGNNEKAYAYIRNLVEKIKSSGKLAYKDDFAWEVKIIKKDDVLNAFCTPGGYIYVYTGLIKYLDKEDHLAGVMGHEMAHADHRHSTDAMTRQYGVATLFDIVLGKNQGALTEIVKNLAALKYSRSNETEADMSSVEYLSQTSYSCTGTAGFFEKLQLDSLNNPKVPQFLSTHPSPENRVKAINEKADKIGCDKTASQTDAAYATFKSYLN